MKGIIQFTAADDNGARVFSAFIPKGAAQTDVSTCAQTAAAKLKNDVRLIPNASAKAFRCQMMAGERASLDAVISGASDEEAINLAEALAAAVKESFGVDVQVMPMRKH